MPLAAQISIVFGSFLIIFIFIGLFDMYKRSKCKGPVAPIDDYDEMNRFLHD
jgi:hypothetical protein